MCCNVPGLRMSAREIILEGADNGTIAEPPRPAGKINFARSVPVEKAMDDVLLAFAMNGEPLPAAHGFPLRAIVPGWYGMASIKWLQRHHRHRSNHSMVTINR